MVKILFKRYLVIVTVLAFLSLGACAGSQFPDTKQGDYAAALTFFNDTVEAYYNVLVMQTPEVKEKWKSKINPKIHLAAHALSVWGSAIGTEEAVANEVVYLRLLQQLLIILVDCNVIEIR